MLARVQALDGDRGLQARVHRDQDAVDVGPLEQIPMVRVDLRDAEIARAAPRARLVEVAARDELADLAALGKLADGSAGLRRVEHAQPEARIEVLRRVAPAADEPDANEARHRTIL